MLKPQGEGNNTSNETHKPSIHNSDSKRALMSTPAFAPKAAPLSAPLPTVTATSRDGIVHLPPAPPGTPPEDSPLSSGNLPPLSSPPPLERQPSNQSSLGGSMRRATSTEPKKSHQEIPDVGLLLLWLLFLFNSLKILF